MPFPESKVESLTSMKSEHSSIIQSSCRICLSNIFDPAALSCGHKYCEKCLYQYWDERDRPEFILCPLCRANAFGVKFIEKDKAPSTQDFRMTFNPLQKLSKEQPEINNATFYCLTISVLMPLFYCVLKWLRTPLMEFFTFLQCKPYT